MGGGVNSGTVVRPMRADDVEVAEQVAWDSLASAGRRYGFELGDRDEARVRFARSRVQHLLRTDPEGVFVAERDDVIVGLSMSIRRGSLWFLSLLTVADAHQAAGLGRELLDRALAYGEGCSAGMICASPDPKALRRYGRAGFALHGSVEAVGVPQRDRIPTGTGVRDGDWERDRDLVEELIALRRGAPYAADLDWCREHGARLLIRDGSTREDRAAAVARDGQLTVLAGASEDAATRVLWAVLAEAEGKTRLGYLHNRQQWAIEVALEAGLPLSLADALATRGDLLVPPSPYLPSGILG
jgi:GNAT superfamily N-acetyltransferase